MKVGLWVLAVYVMSCHVKLSQADTVSVSVELWLTVRFKVTVLSHPVELV